MISFFSNIFGYILNFIYEIVKNYGLAIILFSILLKVLLLPLTIKQQKTMKVSQKIQGELKQIQEKYKNNPEKLNQETMDLYKRENISPFSGCFASIIQLILLLAMFYLVRNPLTYMKKMDTNLINTYKDKIVAEMGENSVSTTYPEISVVKYINKKIDENKKIKEDNKEETVIEQEEQGEIVENSEENKEENVEEQEIDKNLYINMNFFGLDLGSIPKENYNDIKVFIIPILYIISSFVSIKLMQVKTDKSQNVEQKNDENVNENENENKQEDMSTQMNKSMTWMMPVLAVSVSLIAPLGLALYWLVNNILIIIERIFIDKFIIPKEEENDD